MKTLSPAEKQATLSSFIDTDEPSLPLVDRSTLEAYATCPAQARYVEAGALNVSAIASVGEEVHRAMGRATYEHVSSGGQLSASDLADLLRGELMQSRPDLQPDVLRAARSSCYDWGRFICGINPVNILGFDGGEDLKRGGQLAWDLGSMGIRVTSEIDLLHAGPSPEVLHEVDYKSGHKQYTARDVEDSFQFQLHAYLVFEVYPDVQALETRVWNTRLNRLTYRIEFRREQMSAFKARIHTAAEARRLNIGREMPRVERWPTAEKCRLCDAASVCPSAGVAVAKVADDPVGYVRDMVALNARLAAMRKEAGGHIKKHGDIVTPDGDAFGKDKPPSGRAPTPALYKVKSNNDEGDEDGADSE